MKRARTVTWQHCEKWGGGYILRFWLPTMEVSLPGRILESGRVHALVRGHLESFWRKVEEADVFIGKTARKEMEEDFLEAIGEILGKESENLCT